ncbi:hypothetical protein GOP47_0014790 [Adiantum capillus-veneris]|uniref:Vacuolar protein sorting-associated protein 62 n=1 Tax=Adiantum capillus-veneris TaxID=13818 RepID=A0A9D4ZDU2_ADICA|nr:hypothetical protein GOP47_0014790 [Adiantum capillus-veneris]
MKALRNALSLRWGRSDGVLEALQSPPQPFCLPFPLSDWPSGTGFARGHLNIGELVVAEVTHFEEVWSTNKGGPNKKGASFYKPINIPTGYHCLGYYCQPKTGTLDGWVLVAKENDEFLQNRAANETCTNVIESSIAPLASPTDYKLVWSTPQGKFNREGFFWLPCTSDGYVPMGFVVTNTGDKPATSEVMCVRIDLTDACRTADRIWSFESRKMMFTVSNVYPCKTGLDERGIVVGTFSCCNSIAGANGDVPIACLKNSTSVYAAMPNANQIDALMLNYGPVFYFHPDEIYFPSSVTWFFEQGALLYKKDAEKAEKLTCDGCNLPVEKLEGEEYWLGLPDGEVAEIVKKGNLASAKGYVQVKPMLGGIFTDLVIWIYYPFNGPSTAKLGMVDVPLGKIGEHVSDWEHVTLRISNLSGHLKRVYFAQHSGGLWVNASEVEYAHANNVAVYSSRSGHASYPYPGLVLQGDTLVGVGIRNDTARSAHVLETAKNYEVVSAKYLHLLGANNAPKEPTWLLYACEWGPRIRYDLRAELDKVLDQLPQRLKKKNYWLGDERVRHH